MILMGDRSSVFSPARTKSTIIESHLPCSESCDIVDLATQSIETALTATFTYRDGKIYRGTKLGSFNTKEEAAIAYWTARKEFDKK